MSFPPGLSSPRRGVRVVSADGMAGWQITLIAAGAAVTAAVVPAASAAVPTPVPTIPPGWAQLAQLWRLGPVGVVPAPAVRVVSAGGMAGWQITLIAAGAAAVAAVALDRARAARRAAPAATS